MTDRAYVFVSYARRDEEYVRGLVEHLAEHDVVGWIDQETDYGASWPRVIRDRVDGCSALVVVMTGASDESEWVKREVVRAEQQDKLVLPLLLEGLPFFELNTTQYEDVSDGRMPTPSFVKRLVHLTSQAPTTQVEAFGPSPVTSWLDEGRRQYQLKDFPAAVAAYDRALALDPDDAPAHNNRGNGVPVANGQDPTLHDVRGAV